MQTLKQLEERHQALVAEGLALNMERGQPSDANFDLVSPMLDIVAGDDIVTDNDVDIRNYPGGILGLLEARELFSRQLGVSTSEIIIGNNSSLEMMSRFFSIALLNGMKNSQARWCDQNPKLIVAVPGYDRHFTLARSLGFELVSVAMTPEGPDMDAIEAIAGQDASVKGLFFVPTYSNPTGISLSARTAKRLVGMQTAAEDFTLFADDAYCVHHLIEPSEPAADLLALAKEAGTEDRVILFGSTSKVTFSGGGLAFAGMSESNLKYWSAKLSTHSIGPNKPEQWRHVKFLRQYPDGLTGLMRAHAAVLKPKFDAVQDILNQGLGNLDLATWTNPAGGYFVSLDTTRPVASRVVELALQAGVALTPTGATYPDGVDEADTNIRLAPTRPPLAEVVKAMEVVVCCIQLASAEYDAGKPA